MVTVLLMSAKMATLGFLKIKVFWNKCYDVINPVYDITKKILFCDSDYIANVVILSKYQNISIREVIITSLL